LPPVFRGRRYLSTGALLAVAKGDDGPDAVGVRPSVPTLVVLVDGETVASRAEGFPRTEVAVEFLREHAEESR